MLTLEEESSLVRSVYEHNNKDAFDKLITSFLPYAFSWASKYRGYPVDRDDLDQSAIEGLIMALCKFDPNHGVRFATYARWWIRASVQSHVMGNWSLVRIGGSAEQKSLFFTLRRARALVEQRAASEGKQLSTAEVCEAIAEITKRPLRVVEVMHARLSNSDFSLHAPRVNESDAEEWIDLLVDDETDVALIVEQEHDQTWLQSCLENALQMLDEREREIVKRRKYTHETCTLETLGVELGISKERVRQIEAAALKKMKKHLENTAPEAQRLLVG